jgi:hypothetical protein
VIPIKDSVKLPKQLGKPIDTCLLQPEAGEGKVYTLMLSYFQKLWPELNLIPEFSPVPGLMFVGSKVTRSLPYIWKDGIRYSCTGNKWTQADSLAFLSTPSKGGP